MENEFTKTVFAINRISEGRSEYKAIAYKLTNLLSKYL